MSSLPSRAATARASSPAGAASPAPRAGARSARAALLLGSLLLFALQPLMGRTLLPHFGGAAAVWVVCLAAFQTLLLAGYLYAHLLSRLSLRSQRRLHFALLALALLWSAAFALLRPALGGRLGFSSHPALELLLCVLLFVGLPYLLLAANSTLLQAWLARSLSGDGRSIYRLYALSNLGSFAGLLLYPLLLEPYTSLSTQWWGFSSLLLLYLLLLRTGTSPSSASPCPSPPLTIPHSPLTARAPRGPARSARCAMLLLPALSVFALNAVTAHLTLDVMALPLLWAMLLALFLLSYIIGFSSLGERHVASLALLTALSLVALALLYGGASSGIAVFQRKLLANFALLLFGCSFLHASLYRLRPPSHWLTRYYLLNALGGALGGLTASLAMPLLTDRVVEYPASLLLLGLALLAFSLRSIFPHSPLTARASRGLLLATSLLTLLALFLHLRPSLLPHPAQSAGGAGNTAPSPPLTINHSPLTARAPRGLQAPLYRSRGFFGAIQVIERQARAASGVEGSIHEYIHGNTVHGIQARLPGKYRLPTAYFTPKSGGYAITAHPKYRDGRPMRVNIVGLGVGVMLCYARAQDYYRAYEISPEALAVATNSALFSFTSDVPGRLDLVLADARKGLEAELAAGVEPYDVIMIDAFTGDNLPYHLSTREAFELYFKLLKPDGILAVNISNWHLRLPPFMKSVGDYFGVPLLLIATPDDLANLQLAAQFAFFCRSPEGLAPPPAGVALLDLTRQPPFPLPSDEKGSFLRAIRWR